VQFNVLFVNPELLRGVIVICPNCGFQNTTGANFCEKCDKSLKSKKFLPSFDFKNKTSILIKTLILIVAVVGICGIVNAHPVSANSLFHNSHISTVQNGTVYIESGFSGIVKVKDPLLHKTVNIKVKFQPYSTGSGSIVTKNGYIITAFHVVSDSNTLNNKNKLRKMNSNDIKWYVEEMGLINYIRKNPKLSSKFFKNTSNQYSQKAMVSVTNKFIKNGWISTKSYNSRIYIKGLGLNGINANDSLKARLVDVGDSKKDQDIALLKVDPAKGKKLPALAISSKNPKINAKVSIYGYHGKKMEARLKAHDKLKHSTSKSDYTSNYTPFVSSGHLTGKEPNAQGTVYYRTSAITAEGYSGGPVVNSQNKIIGVLGYGVYINGKSKKIMGSLFLSPSYIKKICKKYGVPVTVN
jgi:ribosomal protein L40E/V8-like Glu-specific endopeptidase